MKNTDIDVTLSNPTITVKPIMKSEQRLSSRKILGTQGSLTMERTAPVAMRAVDVAAGGLGVVVPHKLTAGQQCMVAFVVSTQGKKRRVAAVAKVTYCALRGDAEFHAGLQFTEIDTLATTAIADYMKN
ncbi:MAG: PilZ domain-containing protein [Pseudomonadota bacterium]